MMMLFSKNAKAMVWKQQDKERCEEQRKEDLVRGDCFCRNRPAIHKPPVMQDLQLLLEDVDVLEDDGDDDDDAF